MPRLSAILTNKEKAATGSGIDCCRVDTVGYLSISHDSVCESATVAAVARREVSTTVIGNHDAVVVRANIYRFRMCRMDRNGVDFELARSGHHPGIGIACLVGAPEAFSGSGED